MPGSNIHITPVAFAAGWGSLQAGCDVALHKLKAAVTPHDVATAWSDLSKGRLASFVTVTPPPPPPPLHRAQRLNRLTAGALLAHEEYGLLGDKDVDPYRIWRIVPYVDPARQVLNAVRADLEVLRTKVHSLGLRLRVQLGGAGDPLPLRLCLFFGLAVLRVEDVEQLARVPLARRDVQALTELHFSGQPANVGRHFFCSALALQGTDAFIIAAVTGHGHIGAEMFSDSMAVAPEHAFSIWRREMEKVLAPLSLAAVPGSDITLGGPLLAPAPAPSITNDPYLFPQRTGAGRILPPLADPFTLTAISVGLRIARMLASTAAIEDLATGEVPMCAVTLDGTHLADLQEAESQMPGALRTTGQTLSVTWTRAGCAEEITQPLCPRTCLAVQRAKSKTSLCSDLQMRASGAWVHRQCPEVIWPEDDRQAYIAYCALALRLHRFLEAPATLAASSRAIFSAAANRESVIRLADAHPQINFADLPFVPVQSGVSRQRAKLRTALSEVKKALGRYGNTTTRAGEEQKRARSLKSELHPIDATGDLPAQSAKAVVSAECECWLDYDLRAGKKGRQFSTLATYGTLVFSALELIPPGDDMSAWAAPVFESWFERAKKLPGSTEVDDDGMAGLKRFLLVGRDYLGWDVPDVLLQGVSTFKTDGQRKAAAATLVFSFDYEAATPVVERRLAEWPLLLEPARIDLKLREAVPLRTGDRSTLRVDCLTQKSDKLIVQNDGFSDTKSDNGVRLCTTPAELAALIRTRASSPHREDEELLFLDENGSDWSVLNAINTVENEALTLVTGDPSFRPHCCRASAGCTLAWPRWEVAARSLLHGRSVSGALQFEHNHKFNRVVATTMELGHGHVATFLTYYASAWPLLRAISASRWLAKFEPSTAFIQAALGSTDAVRAASSRASKTATFSSAWDVIGRITTARAGINLLTRKQPLPVLAPYSAAAAGQASSQALGSYAVARATGTPRDIAAQRFGISLTLAQDIDLQMERKK